MEGHDLIKDLDNMSQPLHGKARLLTWTVLCPNKRMEGQVLIKRLGLYVSTNGCDTATTHDVVCLFLAGDDGVVTIQRLSRVKGLQVKDIYAPKIFQLGGDDKEVEALVATTAKHATKVREMGYAQVKGKGLR